MRVWWVRGIGIAGAFAVVMVLGSCERATTAHQEAAKGPSYFKADPATAGVVRGQIVFHGKRPAGKTPDKAIDMSEEPACVEAHKGGAHGVGEGSYDGPLMVGSNGALANVFIDVKGGLEGKVFETPAVPVTIDQRGCWFHPRVIGIQTGQTLRVVNSDPVTHNIHPQAEVNREWNHSQGPGDAPMERKFSKREILIPVKCNIHRWMHSAIGVVDNPYFAITGADGSFEIGNLPPGEYVIEAWHETLGRQEQRVTVAAKGTSRADFAFR